MASAAQRAARAAFVEKYGGKAKAAAGVIGQRVKTLNFSPAISGALGRMGERQFGPWGRIGGTLVGGIATGDRFSSDLGMYQAGNMAADALSGGINGLLGGSPMGNATQPNLQVF